MFRKINKMTVQLYVVISKYRFMLLIPCIQKGLLELLNRDKYTNGVLTTHPDTYAVR